MAAEKTVKRKRLERQKDGFVSGGYVDNDYQNRESVISLILGTPSDTSKRTTSFHGAVGERSNKKKQ